MKFPIIAAVLAAMLLSLTACGAPIEPPAVVSENVEADLPPEKSPFPVSFDGETFEHAPAAVVSLSPAVSEMICDLGAAGSLVAASDYCDFPPVSELPKAGSPANPDVEAILSIGADLLITQSPIASTDALKLRQCGVRVLSLDEPTSFAGLCENYIKLAMLFYGGTDSSGTAEAVLSGIDAAMTEAKALGINTTFVVVEAETPDGLMLSPGGTLASDIFSVFGTNLREESPDFTATEEELFELAPETVFYASGLDHDEIEAVFPHSALVEVDFERFERPTVRLAEVIREAEGRLGG